MHMRTEGQHEARLAIVRDALHDFGFAAHCPTEIEPSPDGEFSYRHALKLVYGRSDQGSPRLGAYARRSNRIVTVPQCEVVTPELRKCMKGVSHHLIEADIWPYEHGTGKGLLRYVMMRQSRSTGHVLVTLVTSRKDSRIREVAEIIQAELAPVTGIQLHVNPEPGNAIYFRDEEGDVWTRNIVGKPFLEDRIGGITLGIGAGDFFQANPAVADQMCQELLREFAGHLDRPVLDLYCGVGTFTMALARQHGWAMGVEVVKGAIHRARQSATRGHIPAEFLAGEVGEVLPEALVRLEGKAPLVVVNPARKGLEPEVGRQILAANPMRVAYISCNPRALARDLVEFRERGWTIDSIKAFDMFPQTAHVELLAMLSPGERPTPTGRAPRRRIVRD
jgi:23S rRNA (uracil1939-C5)-methyltransferase